MMRTDLGQLNLLASLPVPAVALAGTDTDAGCEAFSLSLGQKAADEDAAPDAVLAALPATAPATFWPVQPVSGPALSAGGRTTATEQIPGAKTPDAEVSIHFAAGSGSDLSVVEGTGRDGVTAASTAGPVGTLVSSQGQEPQDREVIGVGMAMSPVAKRDSALAGKMGILVSQEDKYSQQASNKPEAGKTDPSSLGPSQPSGMAPEMATVFAQATAASGPERADGSGQAAGPAASVSPERPETGVAAPAARQALRSADHAPAAAPMADGATPTINAGLLTGRGLPADGKASHDSRAFLPVGTPGTDRVRGSAACTIKSISTASGEGGMADATIAPDESESLRSLPLSMTRAEHLWHGTLHLQEPAAVRSQPDEEERDPLPAAPPAEPALPSHLHDGPEAAKSAAVVAILLPELASISALSSEPAGPSREEWAAAPTSGWTQAGPIAPLSGPVAPGGIVLLAGPFAASVSRQPDGSTEIGLSPEELGRVTIRLGADAHDPDRLVVHLVFDRPETMDLFRRNADQLADAMRSAGYGDARLDFGHSGEGTNDGPARHSSGDTMTGSEENRPAVAEHGMDAMRPDRSLSLRPPGTAGLDVRL